MEKVSSPKARGAGMVAGFLDIGDTGPGAIRLETSANGSDNGSIISPAGTMEVNSWQFVAAVVTRDADSFIYRDGEEVAVKVIKGKRLDARSLSVTHGVSVRV